MPKKPRKRITPKQRDPSWKLRHALGHRTTQMIDKYAIGVRQKRMAERVKNIWGK